MSRKAKRKDEDSKEEKKPEKGVKPIGSATCSILPPSTYRGYLDELLSAHQRSSQISYGRVTGFLYCFFLCPAQEWVCVGARRVDRSNGAWLMGYWDYKGPPTHGVYMEWVSTLDHSGALTNQEVSVEFIFPIIEGSVPLHDVIQTYCGSIWKESTPNLPHRVLCEFLLKYFPLHWRFAILSIVNVLLHINNRPSHWEGEKPPAKERQFYSCLFHFSTPTTASLSTGDSSSSSSTTKWIGQSLHISISDASSFVPYKIFITLFALMDVYRQFQRLPLVCSPSAMSYIDASGHDIPFHRLASLTHTDLWNRFRYLHTPRIRAPCIQKQLVWGLPVRQEK